MNPVGRACGLVLLALVAHGCAATTVPPSPQRPAPAGAKSPAPSARPRPAPGYTGRVDDFAAVDTTALRGRRIVLDPGHGGFFRGALGQNGLTEAEVNLGVALTLRGLLEARGAIVTMTRTDDRDFLVPADSTLRSDLAERVRIATAANPDLFVSVHHNADARGVHDVNETQTYYKLGDEGPSLDAAQSVHRYLVRNLGIAAQRISPGNYYVLRNSDAPAILTESSYITNPDVESKLALAAKQRLEAEALYLGIAHYFSRPRPVVTEFRAWADGYPGVDSAFISPRLHLVARVRGPFDQARLSVDGVRVDPVVRGDRIEWMPAAPIATGLHEATLAVRLAGGGAARERTLRFHVADAPAKLEAEFAQPLWDRHQPLGLRVRVLDQRGLAHRDSLRVRLRSTGTIALTPADTTVTLRDAVAWAYFRLAPNAPAVPPRRVPEVVVVAAMSPGLRDEAGQPEAPRVEARVVVFPAMRPPVVTAFALRMPDGTPVRNAPGTAGPEPAFDWINRDGFVHLDSSQVSRPTALAGYRAWPSDAPWPPRYAVIAGGALHGRRIAIDADGGGDVDGGSGPSGTRAANLNLEVARALAAMLRAAGAEVLLTREGDLAVSEVERVQASEAFHADRFVRIGHRAERPLVGYWFSSAAGKRWGERTADRLEQLGLGRPAVAEDAQYPLQQTSCPALYVAPLRVDDAASEARLNGPGTLRGEAYAIYLGLIGEWSDAVLPPVTVAVRDAAGRPVAGAIVTLGGATSVETDATGVARLARTEPGPIRIDAVRGPIRATHTLLDSESNVTLTGAEQP